MVEPRGARSTVLQHRIDGRTSGAMRLLWPLAVRWLHDSVLEDLLDRAELAHGTRPRRPASWSAWVRLHRLLDDRARARETAVPDIRVLHGPTVVVHFRRPLVKDLILLGTAIWTAGESIDAGAATRGSR